MIAHERHTHCERCGATIIFMKTTKGKIAPVNAKTVPITAEVFDPKTMESHFITCPYRDEFRRPTKKKGNK